MLWFYAIIDPLFKIFDPNTNPERKIKSLIKVCDQVIKEVPEFASEFTAFKQQLEQFINDGVDIKEVLSQFQIDPKTVDDAINEMILTFNESSSFWDAMKKAALDHNITNITKAMNIIGNITNNFADPNIPIQNTIDCIIENTQEGELIPYDVFIDTMIELSNESLPIYDLKYGYLRSSNLTDIMNEIIETAGDLTDKTLRFNDYVLPVFDDFLKVLKQFLTGMNVNQFLKEFTGEAFKVSELVPAFENLVNWLNKLPNEVKVEINALIECISKFTETLKTKGDGLTTTEVFESLGITESISQLSEAVQLAIDNSYMYTITSALPDIKIKIVPTLERISMLEVPSLYNFAICLVMSEKKSKNEQYENTILKFFNFTKVITTKPKTFTINDACDSLGVNATKAVLPMKKINYSMSSISFNTIMIKTTGRNTTTMSNSLLTLATSAKNGKVTLKEVSNALSAVEEIVKPDAKPSDNKSNKAGIIIGCSISGVALVAIIIGTVFFIRNKKRKEYENLN